jgi:hypothetical protein
MPGETYLGTLVVSLLVPRRGIEPSNGMGIRVGTSLRESDQRDILSVRSGGFLLVVKQKKEGSMALVIDFAHTAEEKEAVFKLRYSVYTEEMHLFESSADHRKKMLMDPEDEGALFLYTAVDGEVVGAIRMHLGRDGSIPPKYEELYEIGRFYSITPIEKMAVLTRFIVAEKHRSGRAPYGLMLFTYEFCLQEGVEIGFCDCVPNLLHLYLKLGWRKYLNKSISDPEFGIQIPLCMVSRHIRHLEAVGSPFTGSYNRICGGKPAPVWINRLLDLLPYSKREQESLEQNWGRILKVLIEHRKTTIFDGLEESVIKALIRMGEVIECRKGQAIIKAGTVYKNIFIILEGLVEIRLGDLAIAVLGEGEIFGEMAFLLKMERSTDAYAYSESVRVVSLREQDMNRLLHSDSALAYKLLFNISRILSVRLIGLHHLLEK